METIGCQMGEKTLKPKRPHVVVVYTSLSQKDGYYYYSAQWSTEDVENIQAGRIDETLTGKSGLGGFKSIFVYPARKKVRGGFSATKN